MTLRRRLLVIGGLLQAGLVFILYVVLASVISSSFAELEDQSVSRDVQRALNAVGEIQANLKSTAHDYGLWDDLYAFTQDGNTEFVLTNLTDSTMTNLQLNFVAIVKPTAEVMYIRCYDFDGQHDIAVPDGLLARLQVGDRLLTPATPDGALASLITLPAGTLLVASQPILKSSGEGPSMGTLIMGRYLNAAETQRLAETTQLTISTHAWAALQLPETVQNIKAVLSPATPLASRVLDASTIAGFGLLTDLDNQPALIVQVNEVRSIYQRGQTSLNLVLAALVVAGVAFGLVSLLLLDTTVLTRVSQLSTAIRRLDTERDLTVRAPISGRDELSSLAISFNSMAAQLEQSVETLEQRVELQTAQLQASAEVGRAATSVLDPDLLMKQVTALITSRFGYYYAASWLVNASGEWAELHEASGPGDTASVLKQSGDKAFINGESLIGIAIGSRQFKIKAAEPAAGQLVNPLLSDTRSEIALPLRVGDRVLGVLDLHSTQTAAFDEASGTVLQSMADQIAVALSNAEQFRQRSDARRHAENLSESIVALVAASSIQEVIQHLARYANNLVGANRTAVYIVDHDLKQVLAQAVTGDNSDLELLKYEALKSGISGMVFRSGKPVLSLDANDGIEPAETAERRRQNGTGALIVAPLVAQDKVIGTFTVSNLIGQRLFTQGDVGLLMTLAAQSVTMIEKLQAFEQTQRALSDLDALNRRMTGEAWQAEAHKQTLTYERRQTSQDLQVPGLSLHIPIELRGTPIGTITLEDERARTFTDDELALINGITRQLALALENQRLTDIAQSSAQRDRAIAETADKIHQPTDLDAILRVAVNELSRITGISGVGVQLGFAPTRPNGHNGQDADTGRESSS